MTISSTDPCSFLSVFFIASNLKEKGGRERFCERGVRVLKWSLDVIRFSTPLNVKWHKQVLCYPNAV